jgi:hypothetical protein
MNRKQYSAILLVVVVLVTVGAAYWYTYIAPITILVGGPVVVEVGGGYLSPGFKYPTTRSSLKFSLIVINDGCRLGENYPYSTLKIQFLEPQLGPGFESYTFVRSGSFTATIPYDNNPPYHSSDGTIDGEFLIFTQGSNMCMGFPVTISYIVMAG